MSQRGTPQTPPPRGSRRDSFSGSGSGSGSPRARTAPNSPVSSPLTTPSSSRDELHHKILLVPGMELLVTSEKSKIETDVETIRDEMIKSIKEFEPLVEAAVKAGNQADTERLTEISAKQKENKYFYMQVNEYKSLKPEKREEMRDSINNEDLMKDIEEKAEIEDRMLKSSSQDVDNSNAIIKNSVFNLIKGEFEKIKEKKIKESQETTCVIYKIGLLIEAAREILEEYKYKYKYTMNLQEIGAEWKALVGENAANKTTHDATIDLLMKSLEQKGTIDLRVELPTLYLTLTAGGNAEQRQQLFKTNFEKSIHERRNDLIELYAKVKRNIDMSKEISPETRQIVAGYEKELDLKFNATNKDILDKLGELARKGFSHDFGLGSINLIEPMPESQFHDMVKFAEVRQSLSIIAEEIKKQNLQAVTPEIPDWNLLEFDVKEQSEKIEHVQLEFWRAIQYLKDPNNMQNPIRNVAKVFFSTIQELNQQDDFIQQSLNEYKTERGRKRFLAQFQKMFKSESTEVDKRKDKESYSVSRVVWTAMLRTLFTSMTPEQLQAIRDGKPKFKNTLDAVLYNGDVYRKFRDAFRGECGFPEQPNFGPNIEGRNNFAEACRLNTELSLSDSSSDAPSEASNASMTTNGAWIATLRTLTRKSDFWSKTPLPMVQKGTSYETLFNMIKAGHQSSIPLNTTLSENEKPKFKKMFSIKDNESCKEFIERMQKLEQMQNDLLESTNKMLTKASNELTGKFFSAITYGNFDGQTTSPAYSLVRNHMTNVQGDGNCGLYAILGGMQALDQNNPARIAFESFIEAQAEEAQTRINMMLARNSELDAQGVLTQIERAEYNRNARNIERFHAQDEAGNRFRRMYQLRLAIAARLNEGTEGRRQFETIGVFIDPNAAANVLAQIINLPIYVATLPDEQQRTLERYTKGGHETANHEFVTTAPTEIGNALFLINTQGTAHITFAQGADNQQAVAKIVLSSDEELRARQETLDVNGIGALHHLLRNGESKEEYVSVIDALIEKQPDKQQAVLNLLKARADLQLSSIDAHLFSQLSFEKAQELLEHLGNEAKTKEMQKNEKATDEQKQLTTALTKRYKCKSINIGKVNADEPEILLVNTLDYENESDKNERLSNDATVFLNYFEKNKIGLIQAIGMLKSTPAFRHLKLTDFKRSCTPFIAPLQISLELDVAQKTVFPADVNFNLIIAKVFDAGMVHELLNGNEIQNFTSIMTTKLTQLGSEDKVLVAGLCCSLINSYFPQEQKLEQMANVIASIFIPMSAELLCEFIAKYDKSKTNIELINIMQLISKQYNQLDSGEKEKILEAILNKKNDEINDETKITLHCKVLNLKTDAIDILKTKDEYIKNKIKNNLELSLENIQKFIQSNEENLTTRFKDEDNIIVKANELLTNKNIAPEYKLANMKFILGNMLQLVFKLRLVAEIDDPMRILSLPSESYDDINKACIENVFKTDYEPNDLKSAIDKFAKEILTYLNKNREYRGNENNVSIVSNITSALLLMKTCVDEKKNWDLSSKHQCNELVCHQKSIFKQLISEQKSNSFKNCLRDLDTIQFEINKNVNHGHDVELLVQILISGDYKRFIQCFEEFIMGPNSSSIMNQDYSKAFEKIESALKTPSQMTKREKIHALYQAYEGLSKDNERKNDIGDILSFAAEKSIENENNDNKDVYINFKNIQEFLEKKEHSGIRDGAEESNILKYGTYKDDADIAIGYCLGENVLKEDVFKEHSKELATKMSTGKINNKPETEILSNRFNLFILETISQSVSLSLEGVSRASRKICPDNGKKIVILLNYKEEVKSGWWDKGNKTLEDYKQELKNIVYKIKSNNKTSQISKDQRVTIVEAIMKLSNCMLNGVTEDNNRKEKVNELIKVLKEFECSDKFIKPLEEIVKQFETKMKEIKGSQPSSMRETNKRNKLLKCFVTTSNTQSFHHQHNVINEIMPKYMNGTLNVNMLEKALTSEKLKTNNQKIIDDLNRTRDNIRTDLNLESPLLLSNQQENISSIEQEILAKSVEILRSVRSTLDNNNPLISGPGNLEEAEKKFKEDYDKAINEVNKLMENLRPERTSMICEKILVSEQQPSTTPVLQLPPTVSIAPVLLTTEKLAQKGFDTQGIVSNLEFLIKQVENAKTEIQSLNLKKYWDEVYPRELNLERLKETNKKLENNEVPVIDNNVEAEHKPTLEFLGAALLNFKNECLYLNNNFNHDNYDWDMEKHQKTFDLNTLTNNMIKFFSDTLIKALINEDGPKFVRFISGLLSINKSDIENGNIADSELKAIINSDKEHILNLLGSNETLKDYLVNLIASTSQRCYHDIYQKEIDKDEKELKTEIKKKLENSLDSLQVLTEKLGEENITKSLKGTWGDDSSATNEFAKLNYRSCLQRALGEYKNRNHVNISDSLELYLNQAIPDEIEANKTKAIENYLELEPREDTDVQRTKEKQTAVNFLRLQLSNNSGVMNIGETLNNSSKIIKNVLKADDLSKPLDLWGEEKTLRGEIEELQKELKKNTFNKEGKPIDQEGKPIQTFKSKPNSEGQISCLGGINKTDQGLVFVVGQQSEQSQVITSNATVATVENIQALLGVSGSLGRLQFDYGSCRYDAKQIETLAKLYKNHLGFFKKDIEKETRDILSFAEKQCRIATQNKIKEKLNQIEELKRGINFQETMKPLADISWSIYGTGIRKLTAQGTIDERNTNTSHFIVLIVKEVLRELFEPGSYIDQDELDRLSNIAAEYLLTAGVSCKDKDQFKIRTNYLFEGYYRDRAKNEFLYTRKSVIEGRAREMTNLVVRAFETLNIVEHPLCADIAKENPEVKKMFDAIAKSSEPVSIETLMPIVMYYTNTVLAHFYVGHKGTDGKIDEVAASKAVCHEFKKLATAYYPDLKFLLKINDDQLELAIKMHMTILANNYLNERDNNDNSVFKLNLSESPLQVILQCAAEGEHRNKSKNDINKKNRKYLLLAADEFSKEINLEQDITETSELNTKDMMAKVRRVININEMNRLLTVSDKMHCFNNYKEVLDKNKSQRMVFALDELSYNDIVSEGVTGVITRSKATEGKNKDKQIGTLNQGAYMFKPSSDEERKIETVQEFVLKCIVENDFERLNRLLRNASGSIADPELPNASRKFINDDVYFRLINMVNTGTIVILQDIDAGKYDGEFGTKELSEFRRNVSEKLARTSNFIKDMLNMRANSNVYTNPGNVFMSVYQGPNNQLPNRNITELALMVANNMEMFLQMTGNTVLFEITKSIDLNFKFMIYSKLLSMKRDDFASLSPSSIIKILRTMIDRQLTESERILVSCVCCYIKSDIDKMDLDNIDKESTMKIEEFSKNVAALSTRMLGKKSQNEFISGGEIAKWFAQPKPENENKTLAQASVACFEKELSKMNLKVDISSSIARVEAILQHTVEIEKDEKSINESPAKRFSRRGFHSQVAEEYSAWCKLYPKKLTKTPGKAATEAEKAYWIEKFLAERRVFTLAMQVYNAKGNLEKLAKITPDSALNEYDEVYGKMIHNAIENAGFPVDGDGTLENVELLLKTVCPKRMLDPQPIERDSEAYTKLEEDVTNATKAGEALQGSRNVVDTAEELMTPAITNAIQFVANGKLNQEQCLYYFMSTIMPTVSYYMSIQTIAYTAHFRQKLRAVLATVAVAACAKIQQEMPKTKDALFSEHAERRVIREAVSEVKQRIGGLLKEAARLNDLQQTQARNANRSTLHQPLIDA